MLTVNINVEEQTWITMTGILNNNNKRYNDNYVCFVTTNELSEMFFILAD